MNMKLVTQNSTSLTIPMIKSEELLDITQQKILLNTNETSNHLAHEELRLWCLCLLVVPAVTLFGNTLVVLSVFKERTLRNATNLFIVSLATADIILALLVMPLATWVEIANGYWTLGYTVCDIFVMLDVLFSTASILNLVAISLDRYVAVTRPIVYAKHNNLRRVQLSIAFVWIVSLLIALPVVCGLNDSPNRDEHACQSYNGIFIISSSFGSFYLPAVVLLVVYHRIFAVIRKRHKSLGVKKSIKPNSQTALNKITESNIVAESTKLRSYFEKTIRLVGEEDRMNSMKVSQSEETEWKQSSSIDEGLNKPGAETVISVDSDRSSAYTFEHAVAESAFDGPRADILSPDVMLHEMSLEDLEDVRRLERIGLPLERNIELRRSSSLPFMDFPSLSSRDNSEYLINPGKIKVHDKEIETFRASFEQIRDAFSPYFISNKETGTPIRPSSSVWDTQMKNYSKCAHDNKVHVENPPYSSLMRNCEECSRSDTGTELSFYGIKINSKYRGCGPSNSGSGEVGNISTGSKIIQPIVKKLFLCLTCSGGFRLASDSSSSSSVDPIERPYSTSDQFSEYSSTSQATPTSADRRLYKDPGTEVPGRKYTETSQLFMQKYGPEVSYTCTTHANSEMGTVGTRVFNFQAEGTVTRLKNNQLLQNSCQYKNAKVDQGDLTSVRPSQCHCTVQEDLPNNIFHDVFKKHFLSRVNIKAKTPFSKPHISSHACPLISFVKAAGRCQTRKNSQNCSDASKCKEKMHKIRFSVIRESDTGSEVPTKMLPPNIITMGRPKSCKSTKSKLLAQRERKATKTLVIVLAAFLACWVPFFTANVAIGICILREAFDRPVCIWAGDMMSFCTWLGYVNSLLNPIIYTIFNLEFRAAFKKLLHIR